MKAVLLTFIVVISALMLSCQVNYLDEPDAFVGMPQDIFLAFMDELEMDCYRGWGDSLYAFSNRNHAVVFKVSDVVESFFYTPYPNFSKSKKYIGQNENTILTDIGRPFQKRDAGDQFYYFYLQKNPQLMIVQILNDHNEDFSGYVLSFIFDTKTKVLMDVEELYWFRP